MAAVVLVVLALGGGVSAPARGQSSAHIDAELVVEAITLKHRSAAASLDLVYPLLSARGTVELRPGENTLVLRDERGAIARIVPRLREFDQPAGSVRVNIQLVRAGAVAGEGLPAPELSPHVVRRLKDLLRYESYTLLARAEFETQEGQDTAYELSSDFRVAFRLGRSAEPRRLRLENFSVSQRQAEKAEMKALIQANLNVDLGKPMVLGLTRSESSDRALMVIVECRESRMRAAERF